MSIAAILDQDEVRRLREANYNARVIGFRHAHEHLGILRILPDNQPPSFLPGQYCVLGLGNWEPRIEGCQPENLLDKQLREVLKRAYSFSCPMLDNQGHLVAPQQCPYLETHRILAARFTGYRYLTLTTREPENHVDGLPDFVGKRYLQEMFESDEFERAADLTLDPDNTHVFLCGNPAMIGAPTAHSNGEYPTPKGMIEVLENRGFRADQRDRPGNVHFEKYW